MSVDQTSVLAAAEASIVELMPTVADIVATIVENPKMDFDDYAGLLEAAEVQGPLLFITLVRLAAGLAAIAECTPEQVRLLGQPDPGVGRHQAG